MPEDHKETDTIEITHKENSDTVEVTHKEEAIRFWDLKKILITGAVSLTISMIGITTNTSINRSNATALKISTHDKDIAVLQEKLEESINYQKDLIDVTLKSDKVINDMQVRIAFLERSIGLEEYVAWLRTRSKLKQAGLDKEEMTIVKEAIDEQMAVEPTIPELPKPTPVVESPKEKFYQQQYQNQSKKSPKMLDDVKKAKFLEVQQKKD